MNSKQGKSGSVTFSPERLVLYLEEDLGPCRSFASQYLVDSVVRKFSGSESSLAEARAISKFESANHRCSEWSLPSQQTLRDSISLGLFRNRIQNLFDVDAFDPGYYEMFLVGTPGPGASNGVQGTDFVSKHIEGVLTTAHDWLPALYKSHTSHSTYWSSAEKHRDTKYGFKSVSGSKLMTVPKSDTIRRVICVEPSLDMFYQLGLGRLIAARLRKVHGIDLSSQPDINKTLARRGSVDQSVCTIDLASASDSISTRMLEWCLPKHFLGKLRSLRSSTASLKGVDTELHMVSSMGNGFTFPLQTAIFTCAVAATYDLYDVRMGRSGSGWGVFGDDIIAPSFMADALISLLSLLGFSVNPDKTFVEGNFRESCGGDYLHGHNVRPIFIKKADTPQAVYAAINRLIEWSTEHRVPLRAAITYLRSLVKWLPVPLWAPVDSGIRVTRRFMPARGRYHYWLARRETLPLCESDGYAVASLGGYARDGRIGTRPWKVQYTMRRGCAFMTWEGYPRETQHISADLGSRWEATINLYF